LLADPWFYAVSIPAVLLYGVAKGGFAGPMAILAVPLMALVMSPTQAAAILLPILVVMDILVVRTYWGTYDRQALRLMLPGGLFGTLAGFTSFSIHAGGPPFTMYLLPKGLSPLLFAGTAGMFFAVVNAVKVLPYALLGQFGSANLLASLILVPLAPLGVRIGHFLVRHSNPSVYYRVISFFLMLTGAKLLLDGYGALQG
jgi:uncharacterized membrane protein YfcA